MANDKLPSPYNGVLWRNFAPKARARHPTLSTKDWGSICYFVDKHRYRGVDSRFGSYGRRVQPLIVVATLVERAIKKPKPENP